MGRNVTRSDFGHLCIFISYFIIGGVIPCAFSGVIPRTYVVRFWTVSSGSQLIVIFGAKLSHDLCHVIEYILQVVSWTQYIEANSTLENWFERLV